MMNYYSLSVNCRSIHGGKTGVKKIHFCYLVILFVWFSGFSQERLYLSGKGSDDAVLWDFKCSTGRNSGHRSTISVHSNWELQGFGFYTYGEDRGDYSTNPEIGFYKRTFEIHEIIDKSFELIFQGSMTDTKVLINGKLVGDIHQGDYTQFSYDITTLVREGINKNEVEVRKPPNNNNLQKAERIADFWLLGGIYRPIYIDILPKTHIKDVAVDASADGQLTIETNLTNASDATTLSAQVLTLEGKLVGEQFNVSVPKEESIVWLASKLDDIQLWSHEFPNLYRLKIHLKQNNQVVHSVTEGFGFSSFEVHSHDGFYLNRQQTLTSKNLN